MTRMPDRIETLKRSCGHTETSPFWDLENLQDRIESTRKLPCSCCMEVSRLISGKLNKLYSQPWEWYRDHFDQTFPDWKEKIRDSQALKTSFRDVSADKFHEALRDLALCRVGDRGCLKAEPFTRLEIVEVIRKGHYKVKLESGEILELSQNELDIDDVVEI